MLVGFAVTAIFQTSKEVVLMTSEVCSKDHISDCNRSGISDLVEKMSFRLAVRAIFRTSFFNSTGTSY